jgi:two-component sensor histidine kinase/HAMP domain-containing protein
VVSAAFTINELRQRAAEASLAEVRQRLEMVSNQQELLVENARLVLSTLAEMPQVKESHPHDLDAIFSKLRAKNPYYTAIFAFDPKGDILASSIPTSLKINVADRDYFKQAMMTGRFSIGEYNVGRLSGEPSLHFAFPVLGPDNATISCVLVAAFNLSAYNDLAAISGGRAMQTIQILDRAGVRLCRIPANADEPVGQPVSSKLMLELANLKISSSAVVVRPQGDIDAMRSISRFSPYASDFYVLVRFPASQLQSGVISVTLRGVVVLLVSMALALALLYILSNFSVSRQLRTLLRAAMHYTDGDFSVRTGITANSVREISTLARAFDEMADSVASRQLERDRAEAELRASLREKEVLLKEVHHRVKNNFQIVSSLLNLQSLGIKDEESRAAFIESQNRIKSMALIHELLYHSESLSQIDFAEYAQAMAEDISGAYLETSSRVRMDLEVEAVQVSLEKAVPLGLILNELLTNAFKHAFPDNRAGSIKIRLSKRDDGNGMPYVLEVKDDGIGFPSGSAPKRSGSLGMELVENLTRQLRGRLECNGSAGGDFLLRFPEV